MTDQQLYFATGLPCLTVLGSVVLSLFQISAVRDDVREIRTDMKLITGKLSEMDTSIRVIEEKLK